MSGNSLTSETSPYLLQHADNPVDWYPWSEAAFSKARVEAKPVLLSVGYSACHWCHVMAHESFEDEATARLMNEHFVNIKVDREERPDIDAIYMSAVQAMTGHGGWPMTVVMTPEGKPFFGGTYFPKEDRYGQPAFKRVLLSLSDAWKNRRREVLESADNATQYLARLSSLSASDADLSKAILEEAATTLTASFDPEHGGFGHAPKFPPHSSLRFLLLQDPNNVLARQMVVTTLTQMARGGIYDHLGGGFARYSVDAFWLVPHFEKMLYDNAQLVQRYAEAYQLTGEALFKDVIEETLDWVRREMTSPEGGFYSALDADSEGVEGKFYVWDEAEIDDLLGQDAALIKAYYDVTTAGNFEGHSILNVKRSPAEIAEQFGLDETSLKAKLSTFKTRLLAARAARTRPGLDDKILTSWNGLMLAAFADAGRVLGRQDYVDIAIKNATFIRDNLLEEGRLKHSYKAGQAKIAGLLEDYAYYGLGLIALYRSTLDTKWFLLALDLAKAILEHFHDAENGGFFSTPDDGEKLIVRPKNYVDSPNPSENASAAELLLGLARFTDNAAWEAIAANTVKMMSEGMRKQAGGFGTLLVVLDKLLTPPKELALLGDPASSNMQALISVVHSQFMPHRAVALATSEGDALLEHIPFLRGRGLLQGRATAYVCEGGSCQLPVTTADGLLEQLSKP